MKTGRIFGIFALLAASFGTPAMAQSGKAVELSGDVMVEKVQTDESGQTSTQLLPPSVVVPGDKLLFRTNYTNTSAETVTNFVVTNPLPSAVRLAPGEAADVEVSVDKGVTFGDLAELTVSDGEGGARAATEADVTHLRWTLAEIEAGETEQITFYAIVR